ncbi:hypothetical protein HELRODRAFT_166546 [Helobdella robusta]|uniref:Lipid-binding serum glycoprotein C-terminal domain-containing protein n=1 Tax=Helobdella robusta TaxID=6412 RepID=T1EY83_HELRO|nr:hypothetical protein HELRODRAFT_166546 [Helobdella robusta]ESO11544.1 hypothetical protein HELRODRAFT_166546 [Helobdella robusta]
MASCLNLLPQKPGLKVRVSQEALSSLVESFGKNEIVDLNGMKIPDKSGVIETFFGDILYNLTDFKIIETSLTSLKVALVESINGLNLTLSNGSISLGTNWAYGTKKKVFADGNVKIEAKQINLELLVKVDSADDHNIKISSHKCFTNIKNLDIKFEGPNSGFYNFLKGLFTKRLEKPCSMIEKALQKVKILVNRRTALNRHLDVDLSFTDVPIVKEKYVEINLKGEFFGKNNFEKYSYQAANIITDNEESRMLNVWLTRYSVETVLNAFYKMNKLQRRILKDDYPVNFNQHFASSCWSYTCIGFFFPTLRFFYPKSYIEIEVKATETPSFHVMNESVRIYFKNATTAFYVKTADNEIQELFIFSLDLLVHASLSLSGNTLHWKITKHFFSVSLMKTNIGPIPDMLITNAVEFLFNKAVLPELNKVGKDGKKLKLPSILKLENASLKTSHGNILLQTDLKFSNKL